LRRINASGLRTDPEKNATSVSNSPFFKKLSAALRSNDVNNRPMAVVVNFTEVWIETS